MSGQKIIDGLQEVIDGKVGRVTVVHVPYQSPEDIVARVLADGRHIKDGEALIGRATRRKATAVTAALRAAGWRILR